MLGSLVLARTARWIQAISLAWQNRSKPGGSSAAVLLVFVLHSGPWVLAIAIAFAIYIFSKPHQPEWAVFFTSALASPVLLGGYTYLLIRRKRKAVAADDSP